MYILEKINIRRMIFFLIALIHFIIVFFCTQSFDVCDSLERKLIFIFVKLISFILIVVLWQFVSFIIDSVKNSRVESKKENLQFIKYFGLYFLINAFVIALTHPVPLYEMSFVFNISDLDSYFFTFHPNWLQSLNVFVGYHVFPFVWGISLFNCFLYSLIFSYCIVSTKKQISNKMWCILIIPLSFPCVFVLNSLPSRMVSIAWLFVFVISYIIFNTNRQSNNISKTILFSLIAGIMVSYRSEYIILLVFLPIIVHFSKVFAIKKFLLFLVIFYSLFFFCNLIQHKFNNFNYELHNLSYIYDEYLLNDFRDKDVEDNTNILRKIYKKSFEVSNLPSTLDQFDTSSYDDTVKVINILTRFSLRHPIHFAKKNLYTLCPCEEDVFFLELYERDARSNPELKQRLPHYFLFDYEWKHKISHFLLSFSPKNKTGSILKIIYSPIFALVLLLLSSIIGCIIKCRIFLWNFITWTFILFLTLIFLRWNVPLYFYSFVFNAWYIFTLSIILLSEKMNKS